MGKRLVITWDERVLYDAEVDEITLSDKSDGGVTLQGKVGGKASAGGLMELISAARQKTVEERRTAYEAEKVVEQETADA